MHQVENEQMSCAWLYKQSYMYLQYGRYEQAIILLEAVHALCPRDHQALKMLCVASVYLGSAGQAQKYLEILTGRTNFQPESWPEYYLVYARVLRATGKPLQAKEMLANYQAVKR